MMDNKHKPLPPESLRHTPMMVKPNESIDPLFADILRATEPLKADPLKRLKVIDALLTRYSS